MTGFMKGIFHSTKDKTNRNKHITRLWSLIVSSLIIISMQIIMHNSDTYAASGIRIYNYTSKKEYDYTGTQVKVVYDGKKISIDSTPGLIDDGIALVPYRDIFAKSPVKATTKYDKAAGTVTISKYNITIVMKIGSKTAYINGKEVTAPLAPVKIKYVKANETKILVPSRFVFENLGYKYTWNSSISTVSVDKMPEPLYLTYNDGEMFNYTGTQGKVTIDGENIDLGKMPSIITNNTAMLRAKKVFADSKIKATYKYNSKDKTITLTRNGNELIMKVGSPVAYLNGRAIVLDTAPMIVTNHNTGTSFVMVPGSFTASCLGFDYRWDKTTMTSILTTRKDDLVEDAKPAPQQNSKEDQKPENGQNNQSGSNQSNKPEAGQSNSSDTNTNPNNQTGNQNNQTGSNQNNPPEQTQDDAPELGDSAVKWDRGTVLQQWKGSKDQYGVSSGKHSISSNTSAGYNNIIYSISRSYSNYKINAETYAVLAGSPFTTVTSESYGNKIQVVASNMSVIENTYYYGTYTATITDNIRSYNGAGNNGILEINLLTDKFSYDLSLSSDGSILFITIYQNILEDITIGSNDVMDYITLTGLMPLNVVVNKLPGLITIELPKTKKLIDDNFINAFGAKNITYCSLFYINNSTYVYLGLNDNLDYYIVEEGNEYTIMIPSKDKPFNPFEPIEKEETKPITPSLPNEPSVPSEPSEPSTPDTPSVPSEPNESPTKPSEPDKPSKPETPALPEIPAANQGKYEIIIPNPAGISVKQIKHEDQYNRLRFAIRIPGDYTAYLKNNQIKVSSKNIKDVSVFLNSNNETEILVSTSVIQGYEIVADANYIYVNVGNPRDIYKNIVVLDAGHGGTAPGAIYNNVNEKDINFKILYQIGKDFFNSDPSKLKVYYTRETDVDISLADRAAFAEKIGADIFVSLHMNANTNKSVYGTEIYYSDSNNKKNKAGLNSETLAKLLVNNISYALKTNNRGTRAAKYTVVHKNTVPAVLIELVFMSNVNDLAKITDSKFQYNAAKTIYESLLQVFELFPTGR